MVRGNQHVTCRWGIGSKIKKGELSKRKQHPDKRKKVERLALRKSANVGVSFSKSLLCIQGPHVFVPRRLASSLSSLLNAHTEPSLQTLWPMFLGIAGPATSNHPPALMRLTLPPTFISLWKPDVTVPPHSMLSLLWPSSALVCTPHLVFMCHLLLLFIFPVYLLSLQVDYKVLKGLIHLHICSNEHQESLGNWLLLMIITTNWIGE